MCTLYITYSSSQQFLDKYPITKLSEIKIHAYVE